MALTQSRRIERNDKAQGTDEVSATSLRSEGMPIPVQAAHHYDPTENDERTLLKDTEAASKSHGISAISSPATERRDSAGLEELERKSRQHSASISMESSTPEVDRSHWPLLYQMIDVHPSTDEREFPEVARR
jgi:hypothetical protein